MEPSPNEARLWQELPVWHWWEGWVVHRPYLVFMLVASNALCFEYKNISLWTSWANLNWSAWKGQGGEMGLLNCGWTSSCNKAVAGHAEPHGAGRTKLRQIHGLPIVPMPTEVPWVGTSRDTSARFLYSVLLSNYKYMAAGTPSKTHYACTLVCTAACLCVVRWALIPCTWRHRLIFLTYWYMKALMTSWQHNLADDNERSCNNDGPGTFSGLCARTTEKTSIL